MKEKLSKCLIFILLPLHILWLFWAYKISSQKILMLTILLVMAADFALSFRQLRIFSSAHRSISEYGRQFVPYFLEKCLIAGAEAILTFLIDKKGFLNIISTGGFWAAVCIAEMLLTAIVVFVIGAARTMLYHDEKR